MNESSIANQSAIVTSETWVERLLLNLISYSIVLVPIALVVITTRLRLCPTPIQNSVIVQLFVYGTISRSKTSRDVDMDEELLPKVEATSRRSIIQAPKSGLQNETLAFIWCLVGLQLSYLVWGILQEKIMTTKYHVNLEPPGRKSRFHDLDTQSSILTETITFHDSQFLVFINRIVAFVLAIFALVYNRPGQAQLLSMRNQLNDKKPQAPLYEYIYCSLSNILSSWCQYEALKYVNFPTQVLSKSCKIIPVMLMSKLMFGKKYQSFDYLCALSLSLGMFIFLLYQPISADKTSNSPRHPANESEVLASNFNGHYIRDSTLISGLAILSLYLAFDSFTSNWQQSLFSRYGISNWQMMAAANFYSILLTLTSLHQLGTLEPAFKLLASSSNLLFDCILMSAMSSVGQLFVYYTIKRFGSVLFAIIMTLRQFLAILLSCTIYGHRLTFGSGAGLLLVFMVVGIQMWRKSEPNKRKAGRTSRGLEVGETVRIQFGPVVNK